MQVNDFFAAHAHKVVVGAAITIKPGRLMKDIYF
jgi:hypothetical protein